MENCESTTTKNPRRVAAGQRNGRLAANRKTVEGRARSAQNATKHLLSSKSYKLMPYEHEENYRLFHNLLINCYLPQDAAEFNIVRNLIMAAWKLDRAIALETVGQVAAAEEIVVNPIGLKETPWVGEGDFVDLAAVQNCLNNPGYHRLVRYRQQYERSVARFQKMLADYRKLPKPNSTPYLPDEDPFAIPTKPVNSRRVPRQPQMDKTNVTPPSATSPTGNPRGTVPAWTVPEQTATQAPNSAKTNVTPPSATSPTGNPIGTVPTQTVPEQTSTNAPNPTPSDAKNLPKTKVTHPTPQLQEDSEGYLNQA